jgi:hypothetical protein
MPSIVRETFENFKPNVYGPSAFSQNLPFVKQGAATREKVLAGLCSSGRKSDKIDKDKKAKRYYRPNTCRPSS